MQRKPPSGEFARNINWTSMVVAEMFSHERIFQRNIKNEKLLKHRSLEQEG